MFDLALKARIPLITVHTRDPLHIQEIIPWILPYGSKYEFHTHDNLVGALIAPLGKPAKQSKGISDLQARIASLEYVIVRLPKAEYISELYDHAAELGLCIVLINYDDDSGVCFDAGELPVPMSLVKDIVSDVVTEEALTPVLTALRGLTLKEVGEIIRLASANSNEITAQSIYSVRRMISVPTQGVIPVNIDTDFYIPQEKISDWLTEEGPFFLNGVDHRLRPRGLMLGGSPGTGKTEGAKHIAMMLGIPLYRLDLGITMNKYVGQSEMNLSRALEYLKSESPCALLIDEVEKFFVSDDDHGVTTRMLAHLLWFLQEHREKILTVMTTNDLGKIPKELYREGRIDTEIHLEEMTYSEGSQLLDQYLDTFDMEFSENDKDMALAKAFTKSHSVAARVIECGKWIVKRKLRGGEL